MEIMQTKLKKFSFEVLDKTNEQTLEILVNATDTKAAVDMLKSKIMLEGLDIKKLLITKTQNGA